MTRLVGMLWLVCMLLAPSVAQANGGTVQISNQPAGPYVVSVYTEPSPLLTTSVDVSVMVQRAGGELVTDARVAVLARPPSGGVSSRHDATRESATNKLFYAAHFAPGAPGRWEFAVEVAGVEGSGLVEFAADVAEPSALDSPLLVVVIALAPLAALTAWWLFRPRRLARRG